MPAEWQSAAATPVVSEADLRRVVDRQDQWWAGLRVGRDVVASAVLLASGADPDAGAKGGAFGGLASRSREHGQRASVHRQTLSAVSIEYEVRVPGGWPGNPSDRVRISSVRPPAPLRRCHARRSTMPDACDAVYR